MEISNTYQIRVRYADTDRMGFVNNGRYLTYFEIGRSELMRHHGLPYTEFEKRGFYLPLTESRVFYKNPAFYDDLLDIKTILKLELKATVRFDYNIFRSDTTIAKGYTVHVFMNRESRRPIKPPAIFREALASFEKKIDL